MEYKYRMLNPAPFSTESIDFKLSETHLENCVLVSPTKARDSLTYTVSMETIQDQDCSPLKGHYFQVHESFLAVYDHRINEKRCNEVYNLDSNQPIVSIKIQKDLEQETKIDSVLKDLPSQQSDIIKHETQMQNQSMFTKKSAYKISNVSLQPIIQEPKPSKFQKMGKIMTRIHSNVKQNRTITRSRATSRKSLASPTTKQYESTCKTEKTLDDQISSQMLEAKNIKTDNKVSQIDTKIDNLEQVGYFERSILAKTNSSSNGNCSPEIMRRKSDYVSSSNVNKPVTKHNSVFLSDRTIQKFRNYKKFGTRPDRQKIYSTLANSQNHEILEGQIKNFKQKFVLQRNFKQKIKRAQKEDYKSKIQGTEELLNDLLSISAIKLHRTSRNKQNGISNKNINNKNLMLLKPSQSKKNNFIVENNDIKVKNAKQKQNLLFNCADINTQILMIEGHNKKGWRKVKEHIPKKDVLC